MEPACSKACPTDSIQFGTITDLRARADKRVAQLHQTGEKRAYLYGADEKMLGGLNYQIEHHLFPSMPRANLRHAQRFVRAHCAVHHIPYTETGLLSSYALALRYLHDLGGPQRAAHAARGA